MNRLDCHLLAKAGLWDTTNCCFFCHDLVPEEQPLASLVAEETVRFCCTADDAFAALSPAERTLFIRVLCEERV